MNYILSDEIERCAANLTERIARRASGGKEGHASAKAVTAASVVRRLFRIARGVRELEGRVREADRRAVGWQAKFYELQDQWKRLQRGEEPGPTLPDIDEARQAQYLMHTSKGSNG